MPLLRATTVSVEQDAVKVLFAYKYVDLFKENAVKWDGGREQQWGHKFVGSSSVKHPEACFDFHVFTQVPWGEKSNLENFSGIILAVGSEIYYYIKSFICKTVFSILFTYDSV